MSNTDAVFISPQMEKHLELLQHLTRFNNVLVTITGEKGVGKTTLINQLHTQVAESMFAKKITGHAGLNATQLLQTLVTLFHLPSASNRNIPLTLEERIDEILTNVQFSNKNCLLIIDKAHELPKETIDVLLFMIEQQSEHQMRFHVVLAGDPELKTTLSELCDGYHSEDYVHHIDIHPETKRTTAKTNTETKPKVRQPMHATKATAVEQPKNQFLFPVIVFALIAMAFVLYNQHHRIQRLSAEITNFTTGLTYFETPTEVEVAATEVISEVKEAIQVSPEQEKELTALAADLLTAKKEVKPIVIDAGSVAKVASLPGHTTPTRLAMNDDEPVVVEPNSPKQRMLTAKEPFYTLQILGLRDVNRLNQFLKTHDLVGQAASFKTKQTNREWYVVLYGQYPSEKAALEAIKALPSNVAQLKPWPRLFSSIQLDPSEMIVPSAEAPHVAESHWGTWEDEVSNGSSTSIS